MNAAFGEALGGLAAGDLLAEQLHGEPAVALLADRPLVLHEAGHHHDGVLHPLGLVEGHEADTVHVLAQLDAGGQLTAGILVHVEVGDEARDSPRGVGRLPVRREAEEAGDAGDDAR